MNENLGSDQNIARSSGVTGASLNTSFGIEDRRNITIQDMLLDHPLVSEALTTTADLLFSLITVVAVTVEDPVVNINLSEEA